MEDRPYYKVSLNPLPKLHYLKTYRQAGLDYQARSRNTKACEIVFLQEGQLFETRGNETLCWEKGSVHTLYKDKGFHQISDSPIFHSFEIGLVFDSSVVPMTAEELLRWIPADNEAILMRGVTDSKYTALLEPLIKQAVFAYSSPMPDRFLSVRSSLAELFRVMTNCALEDVHRQQEKSIRQTLHVRCACAYISAHLSDPLSARDVAAALGISANYLSKLFSPAMHMSVTEYIHRTKMQQVAHLITDGQMSLSAAAEAVGIGEVKYLSRLFRRYMGISAAQYKKQCC